MNGVLHLSIGDGWWAEGYTGTNGWRIAGAPAHVGSATPWTPPTPRRSTRCSKSDVVPAFYERDARGVPRRWLAMVKQAILTITPRFSARRMLKDYVERAYAPAIAITAKSAERTDRL